MFITDAQVSFYVSSFKSRGLKISKTSDHYIWESRNSSSFFSLVTRS